MVPGLWFLLAALVTALCLAIVGAVQVLRNARALVARTRTMHTIDIDPERVQRSIARLQADLLAMTALLVRAQRALESIDAEIRATVRAFSRE